MCNGNIVREISLKVSVGAVLSMSIGKGRQNEKNRYVCNKSGRNYDC